MDKLLHQLIDIFWRREILFELILVATSIAGAYLITSFMRRYIHKNTERHSTTLLGRLLLGGLSLLPSLLTLLLLSVTDSLAEHLNISSLLIPIMSEFTIAWLLLTALALIIKNKAGLRFLSFIILIYYVLMVTNLLTPTTAFLESLSMNMGNVHITALHLIKGLCLLVGLFWIANKLSNGIERSLQRSTSLSYSSRTLIVKFGTLLIYFLAFILTLSAIGIDLTAFAVFGGALGVGIGLGLQKVTSNFISGVILLFEKSIEAGDVIEISNIRGTVKNLGIRATIMETTDGRDIIIPNDELINSRVTSWTHGNRRARADIGLLLAHDSNVKKAQTLILETLRSHPLVLKNPGPTCFLDDLSTSGAHLKSSFWVNDISEGLASPRNDILLILLEKFQQNNIQFSYTPPSPPTK